MVKIYFYSDKSKDKSNLMLIFIKYRYYILINNIIDMIMNC